MKRWLASLTGGERRAEALSGAQRTRDRRRASGRVLHRPVAGDLFEGLAQNTPDTLGCSRVDACLAAAWEDELWAAGRRKIKPLTGRFQSGLMGGRLEAPSSLDSGLASSLIPLEFLWSEPRCALVAGWDVFTADPRDEDAVAVLPRQIDCGRESGEPNVSTMLITHDGQALVAL